MNKLAKKSFYFIFYLNLFLLATGCHEIVTEVDEAGSLISEVSYLNGQKDGLAKYYHNGILRKEVMYKSGNIDGIQKYYHPNGMLGSMANFKDDLLNGKLYRYYESGLLESDEYWINNKVFGNMLEYYPSGNLEIYRCFDFTENLKYIIQYDTLGQKVREEGQVVGQLLSEQYLFDSIPNNEFVEFKICVCNPPGTTPHVYVGEKFQGEDYELEELPVSLNTAVYRKKFTSKGTYTIVAVGELEASDGAFIKRDSLVGNIIVR